jgi:predicted nucleotide-binding protein
VEAGRTEGIGNVTDSKDSRSVFVVHGRNEDLRRAMFEFLRSINLAPMEWTHAVGLTGVGSPYIGQVLDAAFDNARAVVVLLTPDEIAYLQPRYGNGDQDAETLPAPQARPNVLFEAGMALGRDASRTVLVEVGEVRPFSDVAGRHAVRLSNSVLSRQALAQRLRTAGCDVDLTGTDWHTVGDFTPPPPPGDGLTLGRRIPTGARTRPPVDFDVKYQNKGGNRIDKLQVINRGTETAYDVTLAVPENAALDLQGTQAIERIPGGGKSVTLDVMNYNRFMGGGANRTDTFDITVAARTEGGEKVTQDIFIDLNG